MTYIPDHIRLSTSPDVLRSGAERINENFDNIAAGIDEAIDGLAYQNPVITITAIAPTTGITLGSRYIVDFGVLESDPWYGHIDEIAELSNDDPFEWVFLEPEAGWCCTVLDEELEYLYNEEQWNQRPALISHNLLANIDGETYHVSSDVYDALAGTGTPSNDNKFVTADSLTTDITTHTHDGEVTAQVDYGNLDNIPSTFTPASHTHAKTDITDFTHTHAKTDITDFAHASGHIKGTGDEIDGDKLDIDFNPSYYTPGVVTEADNVDHLSAHLHGIDLELNSKSDSSHTHTYAPLVNSLVPTANLGTGTADGTTYLRGDQTWAILASGNNFVTITGGEVLARYDVVYVNTSNSNKAHKAQCDGTGLQAEVLGMVTEALGITEDGTGQVIVNGTVTNVAWSWTPNKWIYLSATPGALTQTLPTTNGQYVVPVAIALSATQIYIQPMTGWVVSDGDIALGCKKVSFDETSGTVAIVTPPANAVVTQITAVITNAAAGSGGTIEIGVSGNTDSLVATTVFDLTQTGNHVYDPFYSVGGSPDEYILTVTAGGRTFDGVIYFHYAVPNTYTGLGGVASVSFTQATSSPALLVNLPENVVVTRCTVVIDTAASGGSPTVSIGTVGDADLLFDETDCDLLTQGIYLYDPFVEQSGNVYLTLTPDSQSFSGRAYVQFMAVN